MGGNDKAEEAQAVGRILSSWRYKSRAPFVGKRTSVIGYIIWGLKQMGGI